VPAHAAAYMLPGMQAPPCNTLLQSVGTSGAYVPPLVLPQPLGMLPSAAKVGCRPGCCTPGGLGSLWRLLSLHCCGRRCGLLIGFEVQLLIRAVKQVLQVRPI
jgi:hypothetical protein